jgi:hypothetical protein
VELVARQARLRATISNELPTGIGTCRATAASVLSTAVNAALTGADGTLMSLS